MSSNAIINTDEISKICLEKNLGITVVRVNHTKFEHSPSGASVRIDFSPKAGYRGNLTVPITHWLATFGGEFSQVASSNSSIQVREGSNFESVTLAHDNE